MNTQIKLLLASSAIFLAANVANAGVINAEDMWGADYNGTVNGAGGYAAPEKTRAEVKMELNQAQHGAIDELPGYAAFGNPLAEADQIVGTVRTRAQVMNELNASEEDGTVATEGYFAYDVPMDGQ